MAGFRKALKSQGILHLVTLIIHSEFGRTLSPNGGGGSGKCSYVSFSISLFFPRLIKNAGTNFLLLVFSSQDHGWGGNYFLTGGNVNGEFTNVHR